jgi:hypothetical protein
MRNQPNVFPLFVSPFVDFPSPFDLNRFRASFIFQITSKMIRFPYPFTVLYPFTEKSFLNSKLSSSLLFQRSSIWKQIHASFFRSPPPAYLYGWVQQDEDSAWPFLNVRFETVLRCCIRFISIIVQHSMALQTQNHPYISRGEYE